MAVAVVTHDLNLAGMFCDKLVLMAAGQVVRQGSVNEVIEQDILRQVYGEAILVDRHPVLDRPAVFTLPLHDDRQKGKQC